MLLKTSYTSTHDDTVISHSSSHSRQFKHSLCGKYKRCVHPNGTHLKTGAQFLNMVVLALPILPILSAAIIDRNSISIVSRNALQLLTCDQPSLRIQPEKWSSPYVTSTRLDCEHRLPGPGNKEQIYFLGIL